MNIQKFVSEVTGAPYYRTRPLEVARYAYAKWLFSRFRLDDPIEFLRRLQIDPAEALAGFDRWRPLLEEACQRVREKSGLQGGISIEDGIVLYGLTRATRPRTVVETGVAAGISTSFISAALIENGRGRLYSIELPPAVCHTTQSDGARFAWAETGVGWAVPELIRESMRARHTLILEDVRTALPRLLEELSGVDMFLHDDLHVPAHMFWEYQLVWPKLRPGGVLISDDADFGWVRFCQRNSFGNESLYNIQRLTALRKPDTMAPIHAACTF